MKVDRDSILIVGVLHDVIEDTEVTLADIGSEITEEEFNALDSISRRDRENYWDYIERVKGNEIATIVKLADLRHNSNLDRLLLVERPGSIIKMQERYAKAYVYLMQKGE